MQATIETLIPEAELQTKVRELGVKIAEDYKDKDLFVIAVLRGAIFFACDLVRHIDLPLVLDFVQISSYGEGTTTSGRAKITRELDLSIEGKDVLVVEDIADTRHTLANLMSFLDTKKPRSVRLCALLNKESRKEVEVPLDYVGFEIENLFVVGYGLDYAQHYRNLPFVGVIRDDKGDILQ